MSTLIKFSFLFRFLCGIISFNFGFLFAYFGFINKIIIFIYISAILHGFGLTLCYLTGLGFLRFYPTKYFPSLIGGTNLGGLLLTFGFLLSKSYEIEIQNVVLFMFLI